MTRSALLLAFLALTATALPAQVEVRDDLGRTVRLASPATRIVSLAPSITESLFAIGAGDQVSGVTDYCNYPPAALRKKRVGGMTNPSIEAVIALRPDLIVLSMEGNTREVFERLTSLGTPIFVTNPRSLEGIYRSLEQLGDLTGHAQEARHLAKILKERADSIRSTEGPEKIRTLFLVSLQPLVVVGRNTFLNELLETAGGENIAARLPSTYPSYSREAVVSENPDVILVMSDVVKDTGALGRLFPEWRDVSALKKGRLYRIDADIVSRPGPRAVEGLQALSNALHQKPR